MVLLSKTKKSAKKSNNDLRIWKTLIRSIGREENVEKRHSNVSKIPKYGKRKTESFFNPLSLFHSTGQGQECAEIQQNHHAQRNIKFL